MAGPASVSTSVWTKWVETKTRIGKQTILIDAKTNRAYSANELHDEALAFSYKLATCTNGDRISYRLPNGMNWLACFLALQKLGVTAIPLDPGMPLEGCEALSKQVTARLLYYDEALHAVDLLVQNKPGISCIKLTSGTAGEAKSILCTGDHLLADGQNIINTMGIRPDDVNIASIPLGHSYGMGNLVMPLVIQGTPIVCVHQYMPRQLLDWVEKYKVTVFPGVPALFRVLADVPDAPKLTTLRLAISAGAPLAPEVAKAFHEKFGVMIHNFYGSSETGGICYDREGTASLTGRSIGTPLEGVKVGIVEERISVTSGAVAADPSGTYTTDDNGHWNEQGELVLTGRAGVEANIGGQKVHPMEIENLLRALSGVDDAAVWLHQCDGRDSLAVAVETSRSQAWIEHNLSRKLPAWKVPKWYVIESKLPRNDRGKLDVPVLKQRVQA